MTRHVPGTIGSRRSRFSRRDSSIARGPRRHETQFQVIWQGAPALPERENSTPKTFRTARKSAMLIWPFAGRATGTKPRSVTARGRKEPVRGRRDPLNCPKISEQYPWTDGSYFG